MSTGIATVLACLLWLAVCTTAFLDKPKELWPGFVFNLAVMTLMIIWGIKVALKGN